MLSINMDDVIKVLNSIKSQLIGFGVVAVLLIAVMIACRKQSKSKKYLIRWQAGLGMVLALAITVNLILTGPMYSMVTLATGGGKVSEENVASATQLCEDIADEGIVLLDNDGTLPMAKNSKLNVFGWASTNPCYGGTGSGALSDAYPTVTLLEGLKNAGFELNTELSDFYTSYRADRPEVGMFSQDWTLPEPEAAQYTDEMMNNAKAFSDTAMVVITRVGGEGADLPTDVSQVTYDAGHSYNDFEPGDHYLQLSKTEKDMIDLVCKNFDKVIVVYNGANAMELGWVKDYSQIKSVVWCAGTGQSGFNALGSILCGDVNPSGRTIDTFVYDLTQTPTANNFGNFNYTNMDEFKASSFGADTIPAFVNYVEGIYVGYKFYETAAAEGLIDYDKTVVYPFGRGLSYTTFTQTLNSVTEADGTITVDVTVTNTGSASGKEVVEVYYNPPYTNGGIEKATANLIGFAKTSELAPGASEDVTVTFQAEDMASYDTYGKGCYVLEKGDYVISINADSHTVLDSKTYTVDSDIVYDASNKRDSDVEVADKTELYVNAGGKMYSNSMYEMSRVNRYLYPMAELLPSRNWLDAVLGIRSGVAPGFWFDVFAGYKITSDDVLFTQSDVWSANYFGSFSVAEPGIDTKQLFVGANLKYSYQQWFDIALKGVYNNWKAETDEGELPHAWGKPEMELNANLTVRPIEKLSIALDYYLATGRYANVRTWGVNGNTGMTYDKMNEFKMDNINELNLTGTYTFNDTFGVYAKLTNILCQKYELYYGYPMQSFNAMLGVNINF